MQEYFVEVAHAFDVCVMLAAVYLIITFIFLIIFVNNQAIS